MMESFVVGLLVCVFVMSCVIGIQRWWMYTYEVEIKALHRRLDFNAHSNSRWNEFIERKLRVMNRKDEYVKEQVESMDRVIKEMEARP